MPLLVTKTIVNCWECDSAICINDCEPCNQSSQCGGGYCVENYCSNSTSCCRGDCRCDENELQCNNSCKEKFSLPNGMVPCDRLECTSSYINSSTGLCDVFPGIDRKEAQTKYKKQVAKQQRQSWLIALAFIIAIGLLIYYHKKLIRLVGIGMANIICFIQLFYRYGLDFRLKDGYPVFRGQKVHRAYYANEYKHVYKQPFDSKNIVFHIDRNKLNSLNFWNLIYLTRADYNKVKNIQRMDWHHGVEQIMKLLHWKEKDLPAHIRRQL